MHRHASTVRLSVYFNERWSGSGGLGGKKKGKENPILRRTSPPGPFLAVSLAADFGFGIGFFFYIIVFKAGVCGISIIYILCIQPLHILKGYPTV